MTSSISLYWSCTEVCSRNAHSCHTLMSFKSQSTSVNTHPMGTSFVGKVRDVRQIAEARIGEGVADMVEFEAQVNGHEATEKANRI